MSEPCRACNRTYSPGSADLLFDGHGSDYYLTMRDQQQLLRVKNYSFDVTKRPLIMYRWRNDANHITQNEIGGHPPAFRTHGSLKNYRMRRELADSINSWFVKNEDPVQIDHQLRDLWVFEPTDGQPTGVILSPTDPSTTQPEGSTNQDIGWAPLGTRYFLNKPKYFIIRTMYDRDVNLADLTWVVSLAMRSNNNVDAIFLHNDNFVWFKWRLNHADEQGRYHRKVSDIFESLNKPSFLRPRFKQHLTLKNGAWVLRRTATNMMAMSNKLRNEYGFQYGNIGVYQYPKIADKYVFSQSQRASCRACQNFISPEPDDLTNDINEAQNQFYLTPADILTLQSIRNETFGPRADNNDKMTLPGKGDPLMGYFLTNISNQSPTSTLSSQFRNPLNVEKVKGSMPRLLNRLLAHVNYITTGEGDILMDSIPTLPHDVKGLTVFRTMPDRNANMKDVVWALELAAQRNIWVNVFFLHKMSAVWVAARPPLDTSTSGTRQAKIHRNQLMKNQYLRKRTLHKINDSKEMKPYGRVVYFEYPDVSAMFSLKRMFYTKKPVLILSLAYTAVSLAQRAYFNRDYGYEAAKYAAEGVSYVAPMVYDGAISVGSGVVNISAWIPYGTYKILDHFYGAEEIGQGNEGNENNKGSNAGEDKQSSDARLPDNLDELIEYVNNNPEILQAIENNRLKVDSDGKPSLSKPGKSTETGPADKGIPGSVEAPFQTNLAPQICDLYGLNCAPNLQSTGPGLQGLPGV